ncbi:MAG: cyanophycinase [Gemmatimonadaceae bacterium]
MKTPVPLWMLAAASVACSPAHGAPGAAPTRPSSVVASGSAARGTLFIVGGGAQPRELVARFVALAGGAGHARIAVLPMASAEAEESGRGKVQELQGLGADAFALNLTRAEAESDSVTRLLEGASAIWFPGGDQARLTTVLRGTAALRAILARYRAGAIVGGTSAGAAIMSDSMITGDQIRAGEDTSGYFGDEYPRVARRAIIVVPGFGLLPGAIVDQHFIRRERHNRLLAVVLERPAMLGVGIDEGTALRVDPNGMWAIEGASAAVVYDARAARVTAAGAPALGAADVRIHVLPAGSTFDPRTGRARLPRE